MEIDFDFDSLNLAGFGDNEEVSDDTSSFILELATEAAEAASVYVTFNAEGERVVTTSPDAKWRDRIAALQHTARVVQTMYSMGLLSDAALAAVPWLWEREARKRARAASVARANSLMMETLHWLAESQPPMATIVATGLASVQCAQLGTSSASSASRKIRDWHKVTSFKLRKAQEAQDSEAYIAALEFQQRVLKAFLNTRRWAVRENARSVEARALGGNNCKYNPTGAPKSSFNLVMYNQRGESVISPALKKLQPIGKIDAYEGIDSPPVATPSIMPFPKVQVKKKRSKA